MFDEDHTGEMDEDEFYFALDYLGIQVSPHTLPIVPSYAYRSSEEEVVVFGTLVCSADDSLFMHVCCMSLSCRQAMVR